MPIGSPLIPWVSFYVLAGAAGATLTGLQFVVMALVGQSGVRTTVHEVGAFGTPTILYFGAVLLISAILVAPWPSLAGPAIALALCGVAGLVYSVIVVLRVRRQRGYVPEAEDWIWHVVMPFAAYGGLAIGGMALPMHPVGALFASAAATLLLLATGIHNAWDTVIYITVTARTDQLV